MGHDLPERKLFIALVVNGVELDEVQRNPYWDRVVKGPVGSQVTNEKDEDYLDD